MLRRALPANAKPGWSKINRGRRFKNGRFRRDVTFTHVEFVSAADFSGAHFQGTVTFRDVVFRGPVDFSGAVFEGSVQFDAVQFLGGVSFRGTVFVSSAFVGCVFDGERLINESLFYQQDGAFIAFNDARFTGDITFRGCELRTLATFTGVQVAGAFNAWDSTFDRTHLNGARIGKCDIATCRFNHFFGLHGSELGGPALCQSCLYEKGAMLDRAVFKGAVSFANSVFNGQFSAEAAVFRGSVSLANAQFAANVNLRGVTCDSDMSMHGAQFTLTEFGPLSVAGELNVSEAIFNAGSTLQVNASRLVLRRSVFREGGFVLLQDAEVALEGAIFEKLTILGYGPTSIPLEQRTNPEAEAGSISWPSITTLNRTDMTNLVLSGVDLTQCRFLGARNLDRLRLEGTIIFSQRRKWVQRRQAIADEADVDWARRGFRRVSPAKESQLTHTVPQFVPGQLVTIRNRLSDAELVPQPYPPTASDVAELYRLLRKGREDVRDSPGAGDFYYGEMEMRRRARDSSWVDRLVLSTYWLVSGYGLQASRALLAFSVLVLAFALAFWYAGFQAPPKADLDGYTGALKTAFISATSLLRPAPTGLSPVGEVLDAVQRLLGGVLLGLAVFSLRGRIKR